MNVTPRRGHSRRTCNPTCNAVQPGAQRVAHPQRARPADEHQEGSLKRIFNVVRVAQASPADVEDHWPVPFHQGRESGLGRFSPGAKLLEQLPVRPVPQRSDPEERLNVAEYRGMVAVCHRSAPPNALSP